MIENSLLQRLNLKTLMFPFWFGVRSDDWGEVIDGLDKLLTDQAIAHQMQMLLAIEGSPVYWLEATAWPYPDQLFMQNIAIMIDACAPDDWPLEVKTFCMAWAIQSIRINMISAFEKLKAQLG